MSTIQKRELARFRNHVHKLSIRNQLGIDGFDGELSELRQVDQRVRSNLDEFYTGSLGSSMAKNRFDDVKPNEGTIVRLSAVTKTGEGTYINANYIDARETLEVPFVYIATQAPLQNTILDFWRMVYENDVAFIVMLCNTQENGKSKSKMYWPALGEVLDLGLLTISTTEEKDCHQSVHRNLLLRTVRGDEKEIVHMQYLCWPDEGVPDSSVPLMEMNQTIGKSPRSVTSPIVVHCSGGVGRTGIFISLHILLAQFQQERTHLSVPRVVHFLKLCRSGMVQRKDQYLFLYYATMREMERMILSSQTGLDLIKNAVISTDTHSRRPISTSIFSTAATSGPPVMLMPSPRHHKKWRLRDLLSSVHANVDDEDDIERRASKLLETNVDKKKLKKQKEGTRKSENSPAPSGEENMPPESKNAGSSANRDDSPSLPAQSITSFSENKNNNYENNIGVARMESSGTQFQSVAPRTVPTLLPLPSGPSTTLEEELLRVQQANRMKRLTF